MVRIGRSDTERKKSADKLIALALVGALACSGMTVGVLGQSNAYAAGADASGYSDPVADESSQDPSGSGNPAGDSGNSGTSGEGTEPTTPDPAIPDPDVPDPGIDEGEGQLPPEDQDDEDKFIEEPPLEELPPVVEELPLEEPIPEELPAEGVEEESGEGEGYAQDTPSRYLPAYCYPSWSYSGDTSYTPIHYTGNISEEKFIASIAEQARQMAQDYDLYASVMIAQAALESNFGSTTNFNLFGIEELPNGSAVLPGMISGVNSKYSKQDAVSRSYRSLAESLQDYAEQIAVDRHYYFRDALKSNTESWREAAVCMQERYSDSNTYAQDIANIVEAYDLTRFDYPCPFEMIDPLFKDTYDEKRDRTVQQRVTLADLASEAVSHLGTPYVFGGSDPNTGLDCSGFVQLTYRNALGIELPRTTQYQCLEGEDVDFEDLHVGDLLYFVDGTGVVYHVGMYLTDGYYIESYNESVGNVLTVMEDRKPQFAKRIVPTVNIDYGHDPNASSADLSGVGNGRSGWFSSERIMESIRESARSMKGASQNGNAHEEAVIVKIGDYLDLNRHLAQ